MDLSSVSPTGLSAAPRQYSRELLLELNKGNIVKQLPSSLDQNILRDIEELAIADGEGKSPAWAGLNKFGPAVRNPLDFLRPGLHGPIRSRLVEHGTLADPPQVGERDKQELRDRGDRERAEGMDRPRATWRQGEGSYADRQLEPWNGSPAGRGREEVLRGPRRWDNERAQPAEIWRPGVAPGDRWRAEKEARDGRGRGRWEDGAREREGWEAQRRSYEGPRDEYHGLPGPRRRHEPEWMADDDSSSTGSASKPASAGHAMTAKDVERERQAMQEEWKAKQAANKEPVVDDMKYLQSDEDEDDSADTCSSHQQAGGKTNGASGDAGGDGHSRAVTVSRWGFALEGQAGYSAQADVGAPQLGTKQNQVAGVKLSFADLKKVAAQTVGHNLTAVPEMPKIGAIKADELERQGLMATSVASEGLVVDRDSSRQLLSMLRQPMDVCANGCTAPNPAGSFPPMPPITGFPTPEAATACAAPAQLLASGVGTPSPTIAGPPPVQPDDAAAVAEAQRSNSGDLDPLDLIDPFAFRELIDFQDPEPANQPPPMNSLFPSGAASMPALASLGSPHAMGLSPAVLRSIWASGPVSSAPATGISDTMQLGVAVGNNGPLDRVPAASGGAPAAPGPGQQPLGNPPSLASWLHRHEGPAVQQVADRMESGAGTNTLAALLEQLRAQGAVPSGPAQGGAASFNLSQQLGGHSAQPGRQDSNTVLQAFLAAGQQQQQQGPSAASAHVPQMGGQGFGAMAGHGQGGNALLNMLSAAQRSHQMTAAGTIPINTQQIVRPNSSTPHGGLTQQQQMQLRHIHLLQHQQQQQQQAAANQQAQQATARNMVATNTQAAFAAMYLNHAQYDGRGAVMCGSAASQHAPLQQHRQQVFLQQSQGRQSLTGTPSAMLFANQQQSLGMGLNSNIQYMQQARPGVGQTSPHGPSQASPASGLQGLGRFFNQAALQGMNTQHLPTVPNQPALATVEELERTMLH